VRAFTKDKHFQILILIFKGTLSRKKFVILSLFGVSRANSTRESEHARAVRGKLINPANQGDPFYSKTAEIVAFGGAILKNLNMLADLSLNLSFSIKR
jgi:hypothetical protein